MDWMNADMILGFALGATSLAICACALAAVLNLSAWVQAKRMPGEAATSTEHMGKSTRQLYQGHTRMSRR